MGRLEQWEHLEPADLERMSTAGLEKLLLQDFQDPESGEERMEQLYYAAQLLAERTPGSNVSTDRAWGGVNPATGGGARGASWSRRRWPSCCCLSPWRRPPTAMACGSCWPGGRTRPWASPRARSSP